MSTSESRKRLVRKLTKKLGAATPLVVAAFSMSQVCLLYTSPSPRDLSTSRMPSSA